MVLPLLSKQVASKPNCFGLTKIFELYSVKGIDYDLVFLVHKLLFKLVGNNSNIKMIGYQIVFEHIMLSHEKQRESLNKYRF